MELSFIDSGSNADINIFFLMLCADTLVIARYLVCDNPECCMLNYLLYVLCR